MRNDVWDVMFEIRLMVCYASYVYAFTGEGVWDLGDYDARCS